MKRKEREALRALSVEELDSELVKRSKELFELEFHKALRQAKNPLRERFLRREKAAILTWLGQKRQNAGRVPADNGDVKPAIAAQ
ncbi:MAG: 50S ribosomal protein L29 [Elusimicrobia bacterium]|nr:50S ribosomal protein L29 [Elusimicrobiota bacterium]